jgi:phosphoesterase RecJ-like protein
MLSTILDLIKNNGNFIITSHVNPDGDSIGSELALHKYLKNLHKNPKIINHSSTPDNYVFLDANKVIEIFDENKHLRAIKESDVIFVLDTNEYSRLRTMESSVKNSPAKKVCIDHHLGSNRNGFDYYISDIDSPATGEILYKLFTLNGNNAIDIDIARALYTAIMTDTGSFRFPRTDSETHQIIARLIELGVDPVEIYNEVYDRSKIGRLKLLAKFLESIKLTYDDRVAYAHIFQKDFEETGTNVFDTEGFSHHLMSIESVQISVILTEVKRGIKLSFRSKDEIYVNELAKEFGGGGHRNAAGAFITDSNMEELTGKVILKARDFII